MALTKSQEDVISSYESDGWKHVGTLTSPEIDEKPEETGPVRLMFTMHTDAGPDSLRIDVNTRGKKLSVPAVAMLGPHERDFR